MTEHQLSAALYAPIRVLLRESPEEGVVAFEYDRPASVFGQFNNADVNKVAEELEMAQERAGTQDRFLKRPVGQHHVACTTCFHVCRGCRRDIISSRLYWGAAYD
jgi:hypothetical protein